MADVATRAGVSAATVSRALRGQSSVTLATRQRVQAAASALGYAPSAHASALARGRSNAIGVVSPWLTRWFFTTVTRGVHDVVAARGYDLLLYPTGARASRERVEADALGLSTRVDGIVGLALPYEIRRARAFNKIPIVTVGTSTPGIPGVQVDDSLVGYLATRHLIELGHTHIAFLGLDPSDVYGFKVAEDRHAGYVKALREVGLEPEPNLVLTTGFHIEGGEMGFTELLARADDRPRDLPTGIVAVSDEVALGVLYAARQYGLRAPDDLSIVGVDDHDMARLSDLTTVAQPVSEQGRIAAEMLLGIVDDGREPDQDVLWMEPGLIVRGTTGPPRS